MSSRAAVSDFQFEGAAGQLGVGGQQGVQAGWRNRAAAEGRRNVPPSRRSRPASCQAAEAGPGPGESYPFVDARSADRRLLDLGQEVARGQSSPPGSCQRSRGFGPAGPTAGRSGR